MISRVKINAGLMVNSPRYSLTTALAGGRGCA
jgi:hypothetical protein